MLTQDRPTQTNLESQLGAKQLLLKRDILVKAIVTPLWKDEARHQLHIQTNQLDEQLAQLDAQVKQMIGELGQHTIQIVGAESNTVAEAQAQIQDIQTQANEHERELLEQKTQVSGQLQEVEALELGQEVDQGQVENFFYAKQGDHLIRKMQAEVLLRDGVIEEMRGDL